MTLSLLGSYTNYGSNLRGGVDRIDDDHVFATYKKDSSDNVQARIFDVGTGSVVVGAEQTTTLNATGLPFQAGSPESCVFPGSTDKGLFVTHFGDDIAARVATFDLGANTISFGSETTFLISEFLDQEGAYGVRLIGMDTTRAILFTNTDQYIVFNRSGTTVSLASATIKNAFSGSVVLDTMLRVNSSKLLFVYKDLADSNNHKVVEATFDGTTVTAGTGTLVDSDAGQDPQFSKREHAVFFGVDYVVHLDEIATDGEVKAYHVDMPGFTVGSAQTHTDYQLASVNYLAPTKYVLADYDFNTPNYLLDFWIATVDHGAQTISFGSQLNVRTATDGPTSIAVHVMGDNDIALVFVHDGTGFHVQGIQSDADELVEQSRTGPVASVSKFYYDENALTERSDLPFDKLLPGAMAVRSDGVVVIGNEETGSPAVSKATLGDTYGSWTDITDSHPTTGRMTRLQWL
jgi:hypothetical protein